MPRASSLPPSDADAEAADLSAALCRGQPGAATRLVSGYAQELADWVAARTRRGALFGEEMAQEALVRAVRRPREVRSRGELLGRLRTMALRAAIDRIREEEAERRMLRRAERTPGVGGRLATGVAGADRTDGAVDADPARAVEREALLMQLDLEMAQLDADTRTMLRFRFGLGAPVATVARLVGMAPDAVESRLRRALHALRGRMERDAP